ncbi:MAG: membrane protein insertase YidC [Ruminococcaceae bacterium]|nr:membrane protein insertase YidC [Oscillospiraceae bacterium]
MDQILYYICIPLGVLMKWCWQLVNDYGVAILLFTLATKIVLLPITVWIHNNSILMVKIQPEMNMLKVKYHSDGQTLAQEQAKLFKRAKYRPMLTLVPLVLQIVLLLGVVYIINRPLSYLFAVSEADIMTMAQAAGVNTESSSFQIALVDAIRSGAYSLPQKLSWLGESVASFDTTFLGLELTAIPTSIWGIYALVPLLAAASSWLLSFAQNSSNVLQHEQGNGNKYGTMIFSVALSLYLGCFVPAGIALYWMAGNVFSVIQLLLLNVVINPKKHVDYQALEQSRRALAEIEAQDNSEERKKVARENKRRETRDYKRFFSIVNKHLVIYSEKSGFYKYFKGLIAELLSRSDMVIHYVTNDPDDVIFEVAKGEPRIKPYYIGLKKTIPLMLKLECDMVVMTTPDLDKYYLKKSIMKKDIEYVYIPHALMSMHMGMKEGSLDAFDTVFCAGEHIKREVKATERVYGLPAKECVEFGYPLVDDLVVLGEQEKKTHKTQGRREILIAPTWNEDNILDSCIDEMLESLLCDEYHITVRPHPEYVKRFGPKMNATVERWRDRIGEGLTFELDFSSNKSIYSSDLMITDWSGISFEFSFATKRPTLFVNTKMKVLNENWQKIECEPIEITLRNEIGISVEKSDVYRMADVVKDTFNKAKEYESKIDKALNKAVYNVGHADPVGAKYILGRLIEKQNQRRR